VSYLPWANIENHRILANWPPGHTGQTLLDLTAEMYRYHNTLTAAHAASSPWWAWPFDLKPVWFYQQSFAGDTAASIYDAGNLANDSLGLLWIPRNTNPVYYQWYGDKRWFTEYHWHGLALIAGNAYVLAGLALFGLLGALALLLPHWTKEHDDEPGARTQTSLRGRLRLPAA